MAAGSPSTMRERELSAHERLERLIELQAMLARVARQIGPALELEPVLQSVLGGMRELVDFRGGTIQLLDDGAVYIAAAWPAENLTDDVRAARMPVGSGLGGRVLTTGEPIYSTNIQTDDRVDPRLRQLGSNAAIRSYLAVPLVCLGKAIGLLQVDSTKIDAFDADDLHVLEGLSTLVAGSIESARHMESVRQLDRLKSDFLARVSHELRTPLTIIAGFARTLVDHDASLSAADRAMMLDRMQHATARLSGLIDELLTVTQFEAAALVPNIEAVAVPELLERVRAESLRPDHVRVDAAPGTEVVADRRLLRHALGLLVENALKYAGDCEIRAVSVGSEFCFEVADHGPGIPDELREQVFERFTRGDSSRPGMGLGLSLVKTIVTSLGGRIELLDNEGGGARFRLTFAQPH